MSREPPRPPRGESKTIGAIRALYSSQRYQKLVDELGFALWSRVAAVARPDRQGPLNTPACLGRG